MLEYDTPMKLAHYLKALGESESAFARRAYLPQRVVNGVANGDACKATTALLIIWASEKIPTDDGETVSLIDLAGPQAKGIIRRRKAA